MKKISLLLSAILASVSLTGCDALDQILSTIGIKKEEPQKEEPKDEPKDDEEEQHLITISFNSNGGEGSMDVIKIDEDSVELPACLFVYEGHAFVEWAKDSVNGQTYQPGETVGGITQDTTFFAIWEEGQQTNYTVTFNSNGGTGTMATKQTNGKTYIAPWCEFEKEGYNFTKWALNSISGTQYSAGSTIFNIEDEIELFAIWEEKVASHEIDDNYGDYYKSISNDLTGSKLTDALNSLNSSEKKRNFSYADLKTYLQYCEQDWTGEANQKGKMFGFYNNAYVSGPWDNQATWNREHVWPKSRGGSNVEGDLFMTRPASVKINSERGNLFFASSGAYDPGLYEEHYRGVAARIIMYCTIASKSLTLIDELEDDADNKTMGRLSDLLRWNLEYLPSRSKDAHLTLRIEANRNKEVYSNPELQGNRNPFVDHPEYACKIWGSYNSATKQICGGK